MDAGWIVLIVLASLCVLSALWTLVTAPGFRVRDKHVLISGMCLCAWLYEKRALFQSVLSLCS